MYSNSDPKKSENIRLGTFRIWMKNIVSKLGMFESESAESKILFQFTPLIARHIPLLQLHLQDHWLVPNLRIISYDMQQKHAKEPVKSYGSMC